MWLSLLYNVQRANVTIFVEFFYLFDATWLATMCRRFSLAVRLVSIFYSRCFHCTNISRVYHLPWRTTSLIFHIFACFKWNSWSRIIYSSCRVNAFAFCNLCHFEFCVLFLFGFTLILFWQSNTFARTRFLFSPPVESLRSLWHFRLNQIHVRFSVAVHRKYTYARAPVFNVHRTIRIVLHIPSRPSSPYDPTWRVFLKYIATEIFYFPFQRYLRDIYWFCFWLEIDLFNLFCLSSNCRTKKKPFRRTHMCF